MSKQKQEKFLKLYKPIHDRFERFCRARVYGNESIRDHKDLMNETLLIAFEKLETLKSDTAFLSFLFSISVRILANQNRKSKELKLGDDSKVERVHYQNNVEHLAEIHFLYLGLSKLPEDQQEALILFRISGFSIKEIADIQNSTESAIKQRLKRGREKLKDILTDQESLKANESRKLNKIEQP